MAMEGADAPGKNYRDPALGFNFQAIDSMPTCNDNACAADLVDAGTCLPGLDVPVWNYSFNCFQNIATQGGYGSFQALLHNVSCNPPSMETEGNYLHHTPVVLEKPEGMLGEDVVRDMSPSRDNVDESGYLSLDASVYAVNSDDEMLDPFVSNHEHLNYADYKCIEEDMSSSKQCSDDVAGGQDQCPCITSDPFMHVMTEVPKDTEGTWKKRCFAQFNFSIPKPFARKICHG